LYKNLNKIYANMNESKDLLMYLNSHLLECELSYNPNGLLFFGVKCAITLSKSDFSFFAILTPPGTPEILKICGTEVAVERNKP